MLAASVSNKTQTKIYLKVCLAHITMYDRAAKRPCFVHANNLRVKQIFSMANDILSSRPTATTINQHLTPYLKQCKLAAALSRVNG